MSDITALLKLARAEDMIVISHAEAGTARARGRVDSGRGNQEREGVETPPTPGDS